ncbi:type VI secretion system baseplate subunit TssE [Zestomonas carbonaria]|uniref:IraD/Gp25-like domain-containing protein n=1 Tax=Zestomonas carbonaria TaxID=2762745 RepID=A0A7U7ER88_9GAMM|nr:type VI secretion system baseplate subunit TssE [Pseudomonas carbonaria]CAD5109363.1 hypothetical protein PSEWESI4_03660 [Pseudomonas carbonaria]
MPRTAGLGSLFERLDPEAIPRRALSRQDLAHERIQAIKRHLEWLLNSHQGCSASSPGAGLRDFNDASMGSADLQLRVCEDIRRAVAMHEPRVKVLNVRAQPDPSQPLELHFRLDCLVPVFNSEEQMEIDLVINGLDRSTRIMR